MNNDINHSSESLYSMDSRSRSVDSRSRSVDSRCRSISGGSIGSVCSVETLDVSKESSKYNDIKYTKEISIMDADKKKRIRDIYIDDVVSKSPNPNSYLASINITEVWLQQVETAYSTIKTKK